MKFLKYLVPAGKWFCVATVLAELIGGGWLWSRGAFTSEKVFQMTAVVYGVDEETMRAEIGVLQSDEISEQAAYEDTQFRRVAVRLDLDLRETAVEKALLDLRHLETELDDERGRYEQLRRAFENQWAKFAGAASNEQLLELQQTFEAIYPKQAKDQILRMLDDSTTDRDVSLRNVVTIVKAMQSDKRRKILAEFKSEDEQQQLGDILRQIRLGVPDVDLIRDTRHKLQKFDPQKLTDSA